MLLPGYCLAGLDAVVFVLSEVKLQTPRQMMAPRCHTLHGHLLRWHCPEELSQ